MRAVATLRDLLPELFALLGWAERTQPDQAERVRRLRVRLQAWSDDVRDIEEAGDCMPAARRRPNLADRGSCVD